MEDQNTSEEMKAQKRRTRGERRSYPLAKPIMIYPQSEEQREAFERAAAKANRPLSTFILTVVQDHMFSQTPQGRMEEARKRMLETLEKTA